MSARLFVRETGGDFTPASDRAVVQAAEAAARRLLKRGTLLDSPAATERYLAPLLRARECEIFCVAHLDNRHRLIEWEEMFRGTIDGASVHPREVVKSALLKNSAAIVLAHNHPSGVAEPSQADELITRRLREALALIDVRVLDHIIIGADEVVSLASRGLL